MEESGTMTQEPLFQPYETSMFHGETNMFHHFAWFNPIQNQKGPPFSMGFLVSHVCPPLRHPFSCISRPPFVRSDGWALQTTLTGDLAEAKTGGFDRFDHKMMANIGEFKQYRGLDQTIKMGIECDLIEEKNWGQTEIGIW